MPDEIEVPIDEVREKIDEAHRERLRKKHAHAAEGKREPGEKEGEKDEGEKKEGEKKEGEGEKDEEAGGWMRFVAVATAILAVVAAIGALQSGMLVNDALLQKNAALLHKSDQLGHVTRESDTYNYYQAEGLKSLIYRTASQSLPPRSAAALDDAKQSKHYASKQAALQVQAQALEAQAVTDSKAADRAGDEGDRLLERHHLFAYSVSLCQIAIALSAVAALTRRAWVWYLGLGSGVAGTILLLYGFLHH